MKLTEMMEKDLEELKVIMRDHRKKANTLSKIIKLREELNSEREEDEELL